MSYKKILFYFVAKLWNTLKFLKLQALCLFKIIFHFSFFFQIIYYIIEIKTSIISKF